MSAENESGTEKVVEPDFQGESGKRQRSSIAFPYMDLNEAIALSLAIYNNVGTGACSTEQLAPWLKLSANSSGFRSRLATSRLFGLVNTDRGDALQLTELGLWVVDSKREREARAKAFLAVPLFGAMHDKFKGRSLPPPAALEKELVALGVAETLKETARRTLERSAEQAGFFESGRDRLVMPGIKQGTESEKPHTEPPGNGGNGGAGNGGGEGSQLNLDPLLMALLQKIPSKVTGWNAAARLRWFRTFAMNVSQVYDEDTAPVEFDIKTIKESQDGN